MNVVFFDDATEFGGHELMAVAAASGVAMNSDGVVIFFVWEGNHRLITELENECFKGAAIEIVTMPVRAHKAQGLRSHFFRDGVAKVKSMLAIHRPDIVVAVQGRIELGSVAHQAAADLGIPSISYLPMAHTHREMGSSDWFGLKDILTRKLYKLPNSYITVSQSIADQIKCFVPDLPCAVVENFVDADPNPPSMAEARCQLVLQRSEKIVGIIGRIQFSQKGHNLVIEALRMKPNCLENVHFLIVGDGPDLKRLRSMVAEAGLAQKFTFLGWRKNDMVAIYSALDVLLIPSLFEGAPLVMLEGLVYGKHIVGSDRSAMKDWLPRSNRFDPNFPEEIIEVLERVLDSDVESLNDSYIHEARERIPGKTLFGERFYRAVKNHAENTSTSMLG